MPSSVLLLRVPLPTTAVAVALLCVAAPDAKDSKDLDGGRRDTGFCPDGQIAPSENPDDDNGRMSIRYHPPDGSGGSRSPGHAARRIRRKTGSPSSPRRYIASGDFPEDRC